MPRRHRSRPRLTTTLAATATGIALVAAGAIAAGLGPMAASAPQARSSTSPTPPAPATPAPGAAATTTSSTLASAEAAGLAARVTPLLAGTTSCVVVADNSGVVYEANPTTPLIPASTQKLLVAVAALDALGPDYRFVPQVVRSFPPEGGVVANAWLVGGGDPLLATKAFAAWWDGQPRYAGDPMTDFDALAPALKEAGVTSIPGGIHGDDRRYDAVRSIATWPQSAVADHEVNPISALTLNEGYQAWLAKTVVPADPAAFAAATLSGLLGAQGIAAPAGLDGSSPPTGVVLAQLASAPLSAIVGAMLRSSDNQLAELMVKELGYRDDVGTTAGGLAAIESTDKAIGIPLDGVVMRDGSGLDYGDRSTCATLLDTLNVGFRPQFSSIADGLAVAGQSGTLTFRYRGTPMAGKLRAKSGSTDLAGGLVGYLDLGHPVRFAMLFNGRESDAALFQHEDAIIAAMAPYATSGQ